MAEMFYLVEFIKTHDVAVIPSTWLINKDEAMWPPFQSTSRINNAVRNKEPPKTDWTKYSVKILYQSESYEKVRQKLSDAQYHSDLHTEDSEDDDTTVRHSKRRRRSPGRYTDHESSDEEYSSSRPTIATFKNRNDVAAKSQSQLSRPIPPKPSVPSLIKSPSRLPAPTSSSVNDLQDDDEEYSSSRPTIATCKNRNDVAAKSQSQLSRPIPPKPSVSSLMESPSRLPAPTSASVNARDERIFMVLEEQSSKLDSLSTKVNTILRHLSMQVEDQTVLEDIHFPVREMAELEALDTKLTDLNYEKKVIGCLCVIGGTNLQDVVRRILRYTIANSLAMQFNWCGKGNKCSFFDKKLKNTIIKSVRRNPEHKAATSASIEKVMKEWFRTARDRDGGRRRREVESHSNSDSAL